jgi:hypothetical protein
VGQQAGDQSRYRVLFRGRKARLTGGYFFYPEDGVDMFLQNVMLQEHCTFTLMLACILQHDAYVSVLLILLPSLSSPLLLLMVIGDGVPHPKVEYVVTDVGRKWRYQLISVCMMFAIGPCSVLLQNTIFPQALKKLELMSKRCFMLL